jgi:serine/threonine protein kinase
MNQHSHKRWTKERGPVNPVVTQSGTPPYQPPDADLTRWDVSTDLFAVGVVLYQLLCNGHHPYDQSVPMAGGQVVSPTTFRRDLPEDLNAFLIKACAPNRSARFRTASEMRDALQKVRQAL